MSGPSGAARTFEGEADAAPGMGRAVDETRPKGASTPIPNEALFNPSPPVSPDAGAAAGRDDIDPEELWGGLQKLLDEHAATQGREEPESPSPLPSVVYAAGPAPKKALTFQENEERIQAIVTEQRARAAGIPVLPRPTDAAEAPATRVLRKRPVVALGSKGPGVSGAEPSGAGTDKAEPAKRKATMDPQSPAPSARRRSTAAAGAKKGEPTNVRTFGGARSARAATIGREAEKGLEEGQSDDDGSGSNEAPNDGNSGAGSDSGSVTSEESGGRLTRGRAALASLVKKGQGTERRPGKTPSAPATRASREPFRISNPEAWSAPTRQSRELSGWNQEQLATLKRSERRRWSALLTLTLEAERGELDDTWTDRLEDAAAAFSFMVYRYRAYVKPTLRRQMLGHRQIINAFASERESRSSPTKFRAALDGSSDRPFNPEERRYIDGSKANDPPREGRWFWTHRDIGQFREESGGAGGHRGAR